MSVVREVIMQILIRIGRSDTPIVGTLWEMSSSEFLEGLNFPLAC